MRVMIKGVDIHIQEPDSTGAEKDPSLLFIHGTGGDASAWEPQAVFFKGKYLVFRIELPGHGHSAGSGESEIEKYADWVRMAIEMGLGSRPFVAAGHSMGGAIVLKLAANPPPGMKGMVLVGTGARLGVMPAIFQALEENPEAFFKTIEQVAFSACTPAEIRESIVGAIRRCAPSVILKDFKACNRFDIRDQLSQITLPSLMICGEEDKLTPVKYSTFLQQNLPASGLVVVPEAGHMVMVEKPEVLNMAIERFLDYDL